eukprot:TRINITY_DN20615_c0_g1_i2.p1 TRINITY_DN20615_c0_g1~~TRINITY_DN20615_c0_g1_i2.p1  ORF type:complete len:169 (+),score=27.61 TRINITY_DN20615_c0_g1_i2:82-588(+)
MWTCLQGAGSLCASLRARQRSDAANLPAEVAAPPPPPPMLPAPAERQLCRATGMGNEPPSETQFSEKAAPDTYSTYDELRELKLQVASLREQLTAAQESHAAAVAGTGAGGRGGNECVVCMASSRQYAFTPCGHRCVCHMCAVSSVRTDRRCPICRAKVVRILKILDP